MNANALQPGLSLVHQLRAEYARHEVEWCRGAVRLNERIVRLRQAAQSETLTPLKFDGRPRKARPKN